VAAENLALRHQLTVLQRSVKQPKIHRRDRIFWVWLSRLWSGWQSALLIVQPETIVQWHHQGFRLYWSWKSRKKPGHPPHRPGDSESDPAYVSGEPSLGCPTHSI
jgi:hypothetical protein